KRALCSSDCILRVRLVRQRDSRNNLTVCRSDNVHDLAAMRSNKCSIDVVRGDRLDRIFYCCFHGASPCNLLSERSNDDAIERAVLERRVPIIHVTQCDPFRNQIIKVYSALQIKLGVHRYVALEVGGTEVHALDTLLAADRIKDGQLDADLGFGYTDEIKSATNAQHSEALFSYLFQPHKIEDMVCTTRQEIASCFDWIRLGRINDICRTELFRHIESFRLNVDDDDS